MHAIITANDSSVIEGGAGGVFVERDSRIHTSEAASVGNRDVTYSIISNKT